MKDDCILPILTTAVIHSPLLKFRRMYLLGLGVKVTAGPNGTGQVWFAAVFCFRSDSTASVAKWFRFEIVLIQCVKRSDGSFSLSAGSPYCCFQYACYQEFGPQAFLSVKQPSCVPLIVTKAGSPKFVPFLCFRDLSALISSDLCAACNGANEKRQSCNKPQNKRCWKLLFLHRPHQSPHR